MFIGVLITQLYLNQKGSLKNKRQILNSLKQRLKNKFNIAISEIDSLDEWQRATLGIVTCGNSKKIINQILSEVLEIIKSNTLIELIDASLEII